MRVKVYYSHAGSHSSSNSVADTHMSSYLVPVSVEEA